MSGGLTLTHALPFLTATSLLLTSASISVGAGIQDSRANMTSAKLGAPPATMKVTSKAFAANGDIPEKYSGYSQSVSPDLQWSGAPPSTAAFALVMEDPDAKAMAPEPFVHWVAYNIPALTMSLPEGVSATPDIKGEGMHGLNGTKAIGYFGPRPPAGDPSHHYHFQVFALDAELPLKPGVSKAALIAAMKGTSSAGESSSARTRDRDEEVTTHACVDAGGNKMIRKLPSGAYRLYSRKVDPHTGRRRNLGTFRSRAAAERHERAVQFFKRR